MSSYEVLGEMVEEGGESRLAASWTPNNGIRVGIINADDGEWDWFWREFDFTHEQARILGEALIRWSKDSH